MAAQGVTTVTVRYPLRHIHPRPTLHKEPAAAVPVAASDLAVTQSQKRGVRVWFSEKDVGLGVPLLRAIDKGLANSRIGIVLVTPALLKRLPSEGIADKELSALLAGERLVPVVHNTTYEALRQVSPLLASRSGLSTAEDTIAEVATKLAELVFLPDN